MNCERIVSITTPLKSRRYRCYRQHYNFSRKQTIFTKIPRYWHNLQNLPSAPSLYQSTNKRTLIGDGPVYVTNRQYRRPDRQQQLVAISPLSKYNASIKTQQI